MRHVALNVRDAQISKKFYVNVLGMEVEWEPDPENVYLTSKGMDNVAVHKAKDGLIDTNQKLDHIGYLVKKPEDVDAWYEHVVSHGCEIAQAPKTHRDGARSFYFFDPDRIVIQIIHHIPVAKAFEEINI